MSPQSSPPAVSPIAAFLRALSFARSRSQPDADFDAGVNSSSAWTEALSSPKSIARASVNININSLSDEELEDGGEDRSENNPDLELEQGRPARALYNFEGKPEFRELTSVHAGDMLEVLKEEVGEGWSLVKHLESKERPEQERHEIGLLPRSYYAFTADFVRAPEAEHPSIGRVREASTGSITPRGSPPRQPTALPLVPQTTGEWFPSFRRSLLGGKKLNRFSTFVTSGAEDWVLHGTVQDVPPEAEHNRQTSTISVDEDADQMGGADRHFVDSDSGPSWRSKVPPFRILVHSPSKRSSMLSGAYTVYAVTSLFEASSHWSSVPDPDSETDDVPLTTPVRITVHRRFSHFVVLHTALSRRLPGIALPPLPEKQYAGRFNDDFVEARRGDLERYLGRVVRHPIARYAEVLTFFLGCENDMEWKKQYPRYLSLAPAGPSFYANVFHPAFNLDAEDAAEAIENFVAHTRAVGKGVQGLRNVFGRVREAGIEMSKAQRLLAYSLLALITSRPLTSAPTTGISEEDEEETVKSKGHMNGDGAWCWREGCEECLKLTKAMQKTSDVLQSVANLYDDHARRTQLATHESLKSVAHPSAVYAGIVETHQSTLSRFNEATHEGLENEEVAARCETVLNTTMAEIDTYHSQKVQDFRDLTVEHLDGEIAFHEQVLTRLKAARKTFDRTQYDHLGQSPRQPSIYERELEHPRLMPAPLIQPCPHVFDSAPMRPVSVAIQEGVGILLSPARASVFGKFW